MRGDEHRGLGGLCYDLMPNDVLRCRRELDHKGDHYNWPKKIGWPNKDAGKASPRSTPQPPPAVDAGQ